MKQIQKLARNLFENSEDSLTSSEPNKSMLWLMLIVAVATLLRFYGLTSESLWYDEANSVFLSDYAAHYSQLFNVDYNNDPPLFLMILLLWRNLISLVSGGVAVDWLLRFLPCLFSILTVPAVYAATKVLFTYRAPEEKAAETSSTAERTALAASFLVAISPFHRFYAQELRNYSLLTLLAVLVLWVFVRALQHNGIRHWILLSLLLSLSFWTHFFAAWFFIVLNLYMLLTFSIHKKRYLPWALSQVAAGLVCLPMLYYAWQVSQIISTFTVQWIPPPDIKTLFITFKTFFAGYSPRSLAYWPLFLLSGFLSLAGIWSLRRRLAVLTFLLLWTYLAMTVCAIIWAYRDFSFYEYRLFIWSSLSAVMLAVFGWVSLASTLRFLSAVLFILITLPLIYDSAVGALHPVPQHRLGVRYKVDNRGASEFLSKYAFADEPVFHASHVTLSSFRFYLPEHPHTHICQAEEEREGFFAAYPNRPMWKHLDFDPKLWNSILLQPFTFWLVRSWWEPFEIPETLLQLEQEIEGEYTRTEAFSFFGITLIHYERKHLVSENDFK